MATDIKDIDFHIVINPMEVKLNDERIQEAVNNAPAKISTRDIEEVVVIKVQPGGREEEVEKQKRANDDMEI